MAKSNAETGSPIEASVASLARTRTGRTRHDLFRASLLILAVLAVEFAFLRGTPVVALVVLMITLVTGFVLSLAWMRPKEEPPEHHPKIDALFDDTAP